MTTFTHNIIIPNTICVLRGFEHVLNVPGEVVVGYYCTCSVLRWWAEHDGISKGVSVTWYCCGSVGENLQQVSWLGFIPPACGCSVILMDQDWTPLFWSVPFLMCSEKVVPESAIVGERDGIIVGTHCCCTEGVWEGQRIVGKINNFLSNTRGHDSHLASRKFFQFCRVPFKNMSCAEKCIRLSTDLKKHTFCIKTSP